MNQNNIFPVIILTGRPASGKSEILDYLQAMEPAERRQRCHVGELLVIDDFPMLWAWFEEDMLLSKVFGRRRLHTDEQGFFIHADLWNLLVERIGLEYQKRLRDEPELHAHTTVIVEFSRGSEHGGYRAALPHLPTELLERAALLYVQVSFEESLRKNRARYNPGRPDSILEHGLPDDKMEKLYKHDDWAELIAADPRRVQVGKLGLPYAVFENDDDVTSGRGPALGARLEEVLARLWRVRGEG